MNASIDKDLVETTKRLSMGASIVTNLDSSICVLPMKKLHPGLYNSSLSDISMSTQRHDTISKNDKNNVINECTIGVPGFPDFPDCWQGETSQRRNKGDISMNYADKKHKKCTTTSKTKIKRQRRRIIRSAVNIIPKYTSDIGCTGKTLKKKNRDQRKMRRIEKVAQLQNRRRRKREIGLLCKSLSSIKC